MKWLIFLGIATKPYIGSTAKEKFLALIVEQENNDIIFNADMPQLRVKDYRAYLNKSMDYSLVPLNIQVALAQVLPFLPDETIIELLDCDTCHIRQAPAINPQDNQFLVNTLYEDWHLKSTTDNKHIIQPYLKNSNFYNGGFVPIVGKAKTFKTIIQDWTDIHLKIYKANKDPLIRWWAGMYSFQVACVNNSIELAATNQCYFPNVNNLEEEHYIAHYCCDEQHFNKKTVFKNLKEFNPNNLPDNLYYNTIRGYLLR